jgi:hypothetical protein
MYPFETFAQSASLRQRKLQGTFTRVFTNKRPPVVYLPAWRVQGGQQPHIWLNIGPMVESTLLSPAWTVNAVKSE